MWVRCAVLTKYEMCGHVALMRITLVYAALKMQNSFSNSMDSSESSVKWITRSE